MKFSALCLLLLAGSLCAQAKLQVELKAVRQAVATPTVDLVLTLSNRGDKPAASLSRTQILSAKCILVATQNDGTERKGAWGVLASKVPEGSIGALQPGESFSMPLSVKLPESAANPSGQCVLQWVGRGGALDEQRSNEVMVQLIRSNQPIVVIETSEGAITIELWPAKAPNHVANFLTLAQAGFYTGTGFHRTIPGFMIQGGCPKGDGSGGPGYSLPDGEMEGRFERGVLGMGKTSKPNSAGSQFFICVAEAAHLNGKYAAFGRVLDGMEAADKIVQRPTEGDRALNPIRITRVSVELPKDYTIPAVQKA